MSTNQVPSSGSMYSLHLCVIIEALLVVHGEMFSSDAEVCMYVFMFFCMYLCWKTRMKKGAARTSMCFVRSYQQHRYRAHPRYMKLMCWGAPPTAWFSSPFSSADAAAQFYRNQIFNVLRHKAEVWGYSLTEAIAAHI